MPITWSNVVLRLTCDGANNSTTFTDLSPAGHTVTASGNAKVSTAQSKWGGASLYLDGSADTYLSIGSSAQFNFGSAAWMFGCWVRPDSAIFVDGAMLAAWFNSTTGHKTEVGIDYTQELIAYDSDEGAIVGNGQTLSAGSWYHVAFSYDGTTLRGFIEGVVALSLACAINFTSSRQMRIGGAYQHDPEIWLPLLFTGYIDDIIVVKGEAVYTAAFTPPTGPYDTSGGVDTVDGYISAPSMLGTPELLGEVPVAGLLSDNGPLGTPRVFGQHDFSALVGDLVTRYVMDLVTPGGDVRVPISSWQATLQTDAECYVQCVVPACADWLDDINDATEFVIYRRVDLPDGRTIEQEMARAPMDAPSLAEGSFSYSATLSGYSDAFADESESYSTRALADIRTAFNYGGRQRIRCGIDWLLRPGRLASVDDSEFLVGEVTYYVNVDDAFMDVGEAEDA